MNIMELYLLTQLHYFNGIMLHDGNRNLLNKWNYIAFRYSNEKRVSISLTKTQRLFICTLIFAEQFIIYQVGLVPSKYYKVLGDKNLNAFKKTTIYSLLLVCAIAFVSTFLSY